MKKVLVLFLILFCLAPIAYAKKWKVTVPKGKGYVGTLPKIIKSPAEPEQAKPSFEYKNGFDDTYDIKPAPRNNPAFINIIMKKDKTSQYINDLNSIIAIIEDVQTSIEKKDNIQVFNAKSYFLKENVEYLRDKYKNKSEGSYVSFKSLMKLNTHVQAVAQLRLEKEAYSPYLTAQKSGNMFSDNNVNNQLDYLLDEIRTTLVVLKEAK